MSDLPPISNRLQVQASTTVGANARPFRERGGMQPLTEMSGVYRAQRVSSATTPSRRADSETTSDDAHTQFGALGLQMSGEARHLMTLLESPDVSDAEAEGVIDSYFF